MKRKLIAGNWKMHGGLAANQALMSLSSATTTTSAAYPCGTASATSSLRHSSTTARATEIST